ncbi:MAG: discoidin domain-containing protein [Eubacteriales bacterium]|nr:discoidin domain-containing protein [Clostridia bacterium]MDY2846389.1 discoidin domain-containing protein [Eubacteriales bacterium]
MKKLLAVIVAALMLGSFAVTASAADLANYAKDATATEWVAGETEGTQTVTYDLGGIKPLGYFQITWGENVPAAFTVATSSDNSSFADQYTTTDNAAAVSEIEVAAVTSRYVKITITGEGSYEVKELIVRKTKDEVDTSADAKYPSSGVSVPDGSVIINGTVIGNETGWGGNPDTGAAAAFDGDINTFFDPLGTGDGFCGMDAGKPYVLTKVAIHPRDAQLARFYGATIQGSNDGEEWTDIWMSLDEATEWTWHEVEADDFDESGVAYRYYRYYNMLSHGDVAEVEFYGYPEDGVVDEAPAAEETTAPETEAETEAPAAEETTAPAETEAPAEETEAPEETVETPAETTKEEAPQTFDAGIVAAAAAAVSAIGYALSKKRK